MLNILKSERTYGAREVVLEKGSVSRGSNAHYWGKS